MTAVRAGVHLRAAQRFNCPAGSAALQRLVKRYAAVLS